ncbi:hypothetical protein [Sphingobacterium multivorum]|uniref:hypothetical protein n=1 Tax=Sphingobacterium multivorum TaxID=28454 RepID=UPI00345E2B30
MVKIRIGLMIFLCFTSCIDQKLYLRNVQNPEALHTDGVYLSETNREDPREIACSVILLYRNSIMLRGSVYKSDLKNNFEGTISKFANLMKDSKTGFGVYDISNGEVYMEFWTPSSGGPLKTTINTGEIINNDNFRITYMKSNYGDAERSVDAHYKFYPLKNKPDSTNNFIR